MPSTDVKSDPQAPAPGADCRYKPLVALSAQLEVAGLQEALLRVLADSFPGVPVRLCLRDVRHGVWRQVAVVDSEAGAELPTAVNSLLASLETHDGDDVPRDPVVDDGHAAFPVYGMNVLLGAVVVPAAARVPDDEALLGSALAVFGNLLSLLQRSRTDALTGLLNRQSFDDAMQRLFGDAAWGGRRSHDEDGHWCVALLDIDHFKRINDDFGHLYGDEVLVLFAQQMFESFRDDDLLFRYGGEEFVCVLKGMDEETAQQVLDRFRARVEARVWPQVGRVTVSIGYVIPREPRPVPEMLAQADRALYYAKEHGRNQVWGYDALLELGQLTDERQMGSDVELF